MKRQFLAAEIVMFTVCLVAIFSLFFMRNITTWLNDWFPIKSNWTVLNSSIENGTDLLISGTVIKHFDCEYLPPPRAVDLLTGKHLLVESLSITKSQSYNASDKPYTWGPWRIYDGAGKILKIYQVDKCIWIQFTDLGVFNSVIMQQVPNDD